MHWVLMGSVFSTWAGEENFQATALINEDNFCRYKLLLYIYKYIYICYIYVYITYAVTDIYRTILVPIL